MRAIPGILLVLMAVLPCGLGCGGTDNPSGAFSITYHLNGGNDDHGSPVSYTVETPSIVFWAPTRAGYAFAGWYADASLSGAAVTGIPQGSTGNREFWARWLVTHPITYHLNGGNDDHGNPVSYTIETPTITLGAPTRDGYSFAGWYTNADLSGAAITAIPQGLTGNREYWARWLVAYSITYHLNDGDDYNINPDLYTVETPTIVLNAPTRGWYSFIGWYTNSGLSGAAVSEIPQGSTGNREFWAKWIPDRSWASITSSADGTKLAAVESYGRIYTSTDAGTNWTARDSDRPWESITSSVDGTKLAAVACVGRIYTSTDAGTNWTARDSDRIWRSITSSSDGTKLAATVETGQIYTSTDAGITWTARESNRYWYSITSSADGTKLAAVVYNGQIYTSTDSGLSWTARESSRGWHSITSSADGMKLAAGVFGGPIYTSTDSGGNWTARDSSREWLSIASSADGTRLAAVVYEGRIFTSTDSGGSWTQRTADTNRSWFSITSSADGTRLAAVVWPGQIHTSTDAGTNWTPRF